jgi:hypothetical protein
MNTDMTLEDAARLFDAKAQINTRQQSITLVLEDSEWLEWARELLADGGGSIKPHDPKNRRGVRWRWSTTNIEVMETILDRAQPFLVRLSLRAEELLEIIAIRKRMRNRNCLTPMPRMRP